MSKILLILLLFALFGCTYHSQTKAPLTPVTYTTTPRRSVSSIGLLRRLALMPVELNAFDGKYSSVRNQVAAACRYATISATYLRKNKGYEILIVGNSEGSWNFPLFENTRPAQIVEWSRQWQAESGEKHSAELIKKIGELLNVDGVLVVKVEERKPWNTFDALLNIALMDIPLFYNMAKPVAGAWIYETATGKIVWSEEHSGLALRGVDTGLGSDQPLPITELFYDMDNAIPHQLME